MDDNNLYQKWLEDRFNRIDADNKEIKCDVKNMATSLSVVSDKVQRHETYWSITKWVAVTTTGLAASLMGFLEWPKK